MLGGKQIQAKLGVFLGTSVIVGIMPVLLWFQLTTPIQQQSEPGTAYASPASTIDPTKSVNRLRVKVDTTSTSNCVAVPVGESIVNVNPVSVPAGVTLNNYQKSVCSSVTAPVPVVFTFDILITDNGVNNGWWGISKNQGSTSNIDIFNLRDPGNPVLLPHPADPPAVHTFSLTDPNATYQGNTLTRDMISCDGADPADGTCGPISPGNLTPESIRPYKQGTAKRLFASYLPWWAVVQSKWADPMATDKPASLYKIRGPDDMGYAADQIDLALSGGLDGFMVTTREAIKCASDPADPPQWFDDVFATLTAAADARCDAGGNCPFAIAAYIEQAIPVGCDDPAQIPTYVEDWIYHIAQTYGSNNSNPGDPNYHPSYSYVDDRPAMVIYHAGDIIPGDPVGSLAAWDDVLKKLHDPANNHPGDPERAGRQPVNPFLIAELGYWTNFNYSGYLKYFDGVTFYNPSTERNNYTSSIPPLLAKPSTDTKTFPLLGGQADNPPKSTLWLGSVVPGELIRLPAYNAGNQYTDRLDGDFYRYMWNTNLAQVPDWIYVTTWNEFGENTQITDTLNLGGSYLNLTNNLRNLLQEPLPKSIARVSSPLGGDQERGSSESYPELSSNDGRYIFFESAAPDLVPGDTNDAVDIFRKDTLTGQIIRVSTASGGVQATGSSHEPAASADGNLVVFSSFADNLVPNDVTKCYAGTSCSDIFLKNISQDTVTVISTSTSGTQSNGNSYYPRISGDGRYVTFASRATNLAPESSNNVQQVYLKDLATGQTVLFSARLSDPPGGSQIVGNGNSFEPSISNDGRFVAFTSAATNLLAGDSNSAYDVFIRNTQTGELKGASSSSPDGSGVQTLGNYHSSSPSISGDGRYVAFSSNATNLTSSDANSCSDGRGVSYNCRDIFVKDMTTGKTVMASKDAAASQGNGDSYSPVISRDGRYVAFSSLVDSLVSGDGNGQMDVFRKDVLKGGTTLAEDGPISRVSTSDGGSGGNGTSGVFGLSISADGGRIAFVSHATDIVANDDNGVPDVFVKTFSGSCDQSGHTTCSMGAGLIGGESNGGSGYPVSSSRDGRYTAFASDASNLVTGDLNNVTDVFVRDNWTGVIKRESTANLSGAEANSRSFNAAISADGRYLAFVSEATNLVGDGSGQHDIYVKELDPALRGPTNPGGKTVRVSARASSGARGTGASDFPSMSENGTYVAFISDAANLVDGDSNGVPDVFRKTARPGGQLQSTGDIIRASTATGGAQSNGASDNGTAISSDGNYVAFSSIASNLATGDSNGKWDVFRKQVNTGATIGLTMSGDGDSTFPAITSDGNRVAFTSTATNLVPGDGNGKTDVFVRNVGAGATSLVSANKDGGAANGNSSQSSISADGRYVAFSSAASNLVNGDDQACGSANCYDIFVRDTENGKTSILSMDGNKALGNGDSKNPSISADGRFVSFISLAANLVSGDTLGNEDVFVAANTAPAVVNLAISSTSIEADLVAGSAGIDPASAQVTVDNLSVPCTSSETHISCTISGLPGGAHAYAINVADKAGRVGSATAGANIETVADIEPPSVPGGLLVTGADSALDLSWSASTDNVGVAGYRVERATSALGPFTEIGTIASPGYADGTAQAGTRYYYRVRAYDAAGNVSGYSSVADGVLGPLPPANLALMRLGGSLVASWSPPAGGTAGYEVERATSPGGPWTPAGTTTTPSFTDTSLGSDILYYYRVRSYDDQGNNSDYAEPGSARSLVQSSVVTEDNTSTLNWTGSGWLTVISSNYSGGSTRYTRTKGNTLEVPFRGTTVSWIGAKAWNRGKADIYIDGVYQTTVDQYQSTVAYKQIVYSKTGLTDSAHTLRIVATGTKRATATDSFIEIDAIGIYGYSPGINLEQTTAFASWSGPWITYSNAMFSGGSTRMTAAQSSTVDLTFTGSSIAWIGTQAPIRGIAKVYIDGLLQSNIDQYAPTISYQQVLFAKSGLAETTHTLRVLVTGTKNAAASGSYIEVDAFVSGITDGVSAITRETTYADNEAPSVPADLAVSRSGDVLDLSWTASTDNVGVAGYRVERTTSADGPFTEIGTTESTSYVDSTAQAGTRYYYRVIAYDAAGNSSGYSSVADGKLTDTVTPTAPADLAVVSSGDALDLSWTASTDNVGVAGYKVERAFLPVGPFVEIGMAESNGYMDTSAQAGTRYYYRVRAIDAAGNVSGYSSVAAGVLGPLPPANLALMRLGGSLVASWSPPEGGTAGYEVERATSPGGPWTPAGTTTTPSFTDTSLGSDILYYYRVRDYDTQGNRSGYSDPVSVRSLALFSALEEESTSYLKWTGYWYTSKSSSYSGGVTKYTKTKGNALEVPFRGTSVSWIGSLAKNRGKADVYIDGIYQTTVDMYKSSTAYRQTIFSKTGLTDTAHTLKIVATGTKRAESSGVYIDIDAISIYGYSPGVDLEQTTLASWSGGWTTYTDPLLSGGSIKAVATASSTVQLTFKGTSVAWIGTRAFNRGIAAVYVDGFLQTNVDLYSPSVSYQQVLYAKSGLSNTTHKLKIFVTGNKNAAATGSYVDVDAFTTGIPAGVTAGP